MHPSGESEQRGGQEKHHRGQISIPLGSRHQRRFGTKREWLSRRGEARGHERRIVSVRPPLRRGRHHYDSAVRENARELLPLLPRSYGRNSRGSSVVARLSQEVADERRICRSGAKMPDSGKAPILHAKHVDAVGKMYEQMRDSAP
jgi:hypothetical protein